MSVDNMISVALASLVMVNSVTIAQADEKAKQVIGREVATITNNEIKVGITMVALSDDGTLLAINVTRCSPSRIYVWDVAARKLCTTISVDAIGSVYDEIKTLNFSSANDQLVAAIQRNHGRTDIEAKVVAWDIASGVEVYRNSWPNSEIHSARYVPQKSVIAIGMNVKENNHVAYAVVKYVDVARRREAATMLISSEPEHLLTCVAFSKDSKYLATALQRQQTVQVWHVHTGRPVWSMPLGDLMFEPGRSAAFSPDGKLLAAVGQFNPGMHSQTPITGIRVAKLTGRGHFVDIPTKCTDLRFSEKGRLVAAIADTNRNAQQRTLQRHGAIMVWELRKGGSTWYLTEGTKEDNRANWDSTVAFVFQGEGKVIGASVEGVGDASVGDASVYESRGTSERTVGDLTIRSNEPLLVGFRDQTVKLREYDLTSLAPVMGNQRPRGGKH